MPITLDATEVECDDLEDCVVDLVRLRFILIFLVNRNQIELEIQKLEPIPPSDLDADLETTVNPSLAATYYKNQHGEMVSALTRLNRMLRLTPVMPYVFCNLLQKDKNANMERTSFVDLIKWVKPAFTKFLPRPSSIEDTNCMPSGTLSQ